MPVSAQNDFKDMAMDIGRHARVVVHSHCKDGADTVIANHVSIAKEPEIVDIGKVRHQLELVAQPTPFRTTVLELASKGLVSPNLLLALLKMGGKQLQCESVREDAKTCESVRGYARTRLDEYETPAVVLCLLHPAWPLETW